jgi:hypothetical protein
MVKSWSAAKRLHSERASAVAIANATQGMVELVDHTHALTALIGTIKVRQGDDDYAIVDVLHRLLQTSQAELLAIRERALDLEVAGVAMRVMHPLDVLSSRIAKTLRRRAVVTAVDCQPTVNNKARHSGTMSCMSSANPHRT